jgi:O-antigen/teichoic acid export membrane protein
VTEQPELRRLARGGLGGLLAAVVSAAGGLAFIAVITRNYDTSSAGVVFTLTSLFLITLAIATLGSDTGVVRFVALKRVQQPQQIGAVMSSILIPVVLLSLLLALTFWWAIPPLLNDTRYAARVDEARLLAAFLPIAAVSNLTLAATRGFGNVRPTIMTESLLRQGLQPVLALVAALLQADAFWLVAAWIAPYAASCLGGLLAYGATCRRQGVRMWVSPRSPVAAGVIGEVWRFNAPRSITQIAQMSIRRADIPLVAILAGDSAAAIYTAASRFVASGLQGIKGIQQMVGPQIARLVASGEFTQAGATLRTATTWNVLLAWPIYLACAALPGLVIALFDDPKYDYSAGESVVVILALAMLIGTAAGPVDIALLMLGRSVQSLRNNMAALLVNLGLNFALIPLWGINGAAVAWAASILVSNALPTWQIRRHLGPTSDRRTLLAGGLAVGVFGAIPLAAGLFTVSLWWHLASVLVAGLVYAGLVFGFRDALLLSDLISGLRRRRGALASPEKRTGVATGRPQGSAASTSRAQRDRDPQDPPRSDRNRA